MKLNIHERPLHAAPDQVGALIDTLASPKDALCPIYWWPRMQFDRPLSVGATGGHGTIRYFVEEYYPGKSITFRFTAPPEFTGFHGYEIVEKADQSVLLRHTLQITTHGRTRLSWPLMFRPLHDALIEDSLTMAQVSLGLSPQVQPWSLWVRFLRWIMSGGKARAHVLPTSHTQILR